MKLVLVTGMSGAGKSVALKTLEDAGYEAIDNIPLVLLPAVTKVGSGSDRQLAVGVDIRTRDYSAQGFEAIIQGFRADSALELTILFLDCDDEVLRRRFTETRRKHPLAQDRPVLDGIQLERRLIGHIAKIADLTIDTTDTRAADLRRIVAGQIAAAERALSVHVMSFSFKQGLPREADMVFDVRFLKNPHYVLELNQLTGLNKAVGDYIETDAGFADFFNHLTTLVLPLLPRYLDEGKSYLTIAIGCTGGKHRSVYVAEKLADYINQNGFEADVSHRDIPIDQNENV
jgi:UPF0042 nucleotide-binding protein